MFPLGSQRVTALLMLIDTTHQYLLNRCVPCTLYRDMEEEASRPPSTIVKKRRCLDTNCTNCVSFMTRDYLNGQ